MANSNSSTQTVSPAQQQVLDVQSMAQSRMVIQTKVQKVLPNVGVLCEVHSGHSSGVSPMDGLVHFSELQGGKKRLATIQPGTEIIVMVTQAGWKDGSRQLRVSLSENEVLASQGRKRLAEVLADKVEIEMRVSYSNFRSNKLDLVPVDGPSFKAVLDYGSQPTTVQKQLNATREGAVLKVVATNKQPHLTGQGILSVRIAGEVPQSQPKAPRVSQHQLANANKAPKGKSGKK